MGRFDRTLFISQPPLLAFGPGCASRCAAELNARDLKRAFVVTSPPTRPLVARALPSAQFQGAIACHDAPPEPTVGHFREALGAAREMQPDAVIGVGGGSALDVAKLVAAFCNSEQDVTEAFGIDQYRGRRPIYLACLPTTSGTGSEVSPNAILLDESAKLKKGVISPQLMPDAAIVDPELTLSLPRAVTASTGLDALTHCIEAYVNRLAHPLIDTWAIDGVRLIGSSLERACNEGSDIDARSAMSLGSLYGGLCLGPVNTGAVHALAYPLGSEFHIAHGVSNALLLPHVLRFNLPAAPARYAEVAVAMGEARDGSDEQVALRGIERIVGLIARCGVPARLRDLDIPRDAIPRMADAALTITRLLERNVRTVTRADAIDIYEKAF